VVIRLRCFDVGGVVHRRTSRRVLIGHVDNRNHPIGQIMFMGHHRSQVFTSKCGPSAMSWSPRSSSSSRYHEVNKKSQEDIVSFTEMDHRIVDDSEYLIR